MTPCLKWRLSIGTCAPLWLCQIFGHRISFWDGGAEKCQSPESRLDRATSRDGSTSNKGSVNYEHPHLELSLSADQVILLQKSVIATRPLQFAPSEVLLIVVFQTLC
jgi:hypothetical protein